LEVQNKPLDIYNKLELLVKLFRVIMFNKKIISRPSFDLPAKEKLYYDVESTEPLTKKQWLLDQALLSTVLSINPQNNYFK